MAFLQNREDVDFAIATGNATHVRFYENQTGGTHFWELTASAAALGSNQFYRIPALAISIEIPTGTGVDNEAAEKALVGIVSDEESNDIYLGVVNSSGNLIGSRVVMTYDSESEDSDWVIGETQQG